MTYEQALQIAMEELDEKIKVLSDTFKGHSARVESYIYDLSMARKALMQASKEKREWVGLDHKGNCVTRPYPFNPQMIKKEMESKREWVGLTKKEIDSISERVKPDPLMTEEPTWHIRFAQALQRKLKEKNT